jgi:hypothetical protein
MAREPHGHVGARRLGVVGGHGGEGGMVILGEVDPAEKGEVEDGAVGECVYPRGTSSARSHARAG